MHARHGGARLVGPESAHADRRGRGTYDVGRAGVFVARPAPILRADAPYAGCPRPAPAWMARCPPGQLAAASVLALALLTLVRPTDRRRDRRHDRLERPADPDHHDSGPRLPGPAPRRPAVRVLRRRHRLVRHVPVRERGDLRAGDPGRHGGQRVAPWTEVSQAPVSGSGSGFDPYRLVTVVDAGDQRDPGRADGFVRVGDEAYRTDLKLSNSTGSEMRGILYRAVTAISRTPTSATGGSTPAPRPASSHRRRTRGSSNGCPITGGSHYLEAGYQEVWTAIGEADLVPRHVPCDVAVDNGAGLSWEVTIPANGSVTISHDTFFSPLGRAAAGRALRDAVPGPADISLDPVVIASSAVIATGIVFFVPFPATLFNSTLEEHYAEVTAIRRSRPTPDGAHARPPLGVGARRGRRADGRIARRHAIDLRPAHGSRRGGTAGAAEPDDESLFWRTPLGILAFVGISALLYAFLDPTFGFDLLSVATFLGLGLGMLVMLASIAVPLVFGARGSGLGRMSANALPGTLLIALGCVILSRVADFQPGYLYGMIVGFAFTRELSRLEQGRLDAFATITGLVVAILAWILLPVVRGGSTGGEQPFTERAARDRVRDRRRGGARGRGVRHDAAPLPARGAGAGVEPARLGGDPGRGDVRVRPHPPQPVLRLPRRFHADLAHHRGPAARPLRRRIGPVLGLVPPAPPADRRSPGRCRPPRRPRARPNRSAPPGRRRCAPRSRRSATRRCGRRSRSPR